MTEALSGFAFSLYLVCFISLITTRRFYFGIAMAVFGVFVVSLRMSYYATVTLGSVALFVYGIGVRWPNILKTTACILTLLCGFAGYKLLNGRLSDRDPALMYADGLLLLTGVSPLITQDDFIESEIPSGIFKQWKPASLRWYSRGYELFNPNGLASTLKSYFLSVEEANWIAKKIATRCILNKPVKFLRLGLSSYRFYFTENAYRSSISSQFEGLYRGAGDEPFEHGLRKKYVDVPPRGKLNSGLVHYYSYFRYWFLLLLIFPLIGTILLFLKSFRSEMSVFIMVLYCLNALVLFVTNGDAELRYLHSMPFLFMLICGVFTKQVRPLAS
ncbi:MAG: hypothetical protein ACKOA8_20255 [Deltaproteobacteria bacterium]